VATVTAEQILAIAQGEIGTKATGQNNVKYNTAYYGREINGAGYAWCACFVWWCFRQAGASDLYYGSGKTAYCPTLLSYHRRQAVTEYQPGDVIFFNFSGKGNAAHVGLCERYDGTYITTIDGNTSSASEANGGTVARKKRNKSYIVGAYRPAYQSTKEEADMLTQEQFEAMMDKYLSSLARREPSNWSEEARTWAECNGILAGDGSGNKQYKKFCTREELVQILFHQREKEQGGAGR